MIETVGRRSGVTELRTVHPGTAEYRRWIDIVADAYPIMKLPTVEGRDAAFETQRDLGERQPEHRLVGAFRDGLLVGGMRLYDFTMCVRGAQVFTGGVGGVAVSLEHKRRGIARDLIAGYLAEYRERGAALGVLYPFRTDFYAAMGFGFGAKMNQYRIALGTLADDAARACVRALGPADADAFLATYNRVQARTNGLIRREAWRAAARLTGGTFLSFGFFEGARLRGYLTVEIQLCEQAQTNRNDLFVHEFIYESPAAFRGLLAFARSQSDQFATLIMNTQDPDFHFAVADPRNGSDRSLYPPVYHETNVQGLGVMYRVLDTPALLRALDTSAFGELTATLRIDLADAFFAANAGAYTIRFERGRPQMVAPRSARIAAAAGSPEADLALDVADFSALVMGSVRLRSLLKFGRATLSNEAWLERLDAAFGTDPPQCLTRF